MNARDLLALLQRERGSAGSGRAYDALTRERYVSAMQQEDPAMRQAMEVNLAKLDALYREFERRLPTADQSVQDYARLVHAKERLDVTLGSGGAWPPRANLVIGTVETEHMNALTAHCGEPDEYLIVFNRALLTAFLRACNYVTCAFTGPSTAGWPDEHVQSEVIMRVASPYRELLAAVSDVRLPEPRNTFSFLGGDDADEVQYRQLRWQLMEDLVTDYVFAHEYAHVLLDHLKRPDAAPPTDDHGGWAHEYEADSFALKLVVHTWMNRLRGDAVTMSWLFQSVALFFIVTSQVERYEAEVLGRPEGVWRHDRSHPPTWIRYMRLTSELGRYSYLPWDQVAPRLQGAEECLERMYGTAVEGSVSRSPAALEWRFQRLAFESLGLGLRPHHLIVVARAVQAALESGRRPDRRQVDACVAEANRELVAAGASRVGSVTRELLAVVSLLSGHALEYSSIVGHSGVRAFAGGLARIALHDARARYGGT
jgi:hypothetical protein